MGGGPLQEREIRLIATQYRTGSGSDRILDSADAKDRR